MARLSYIGLLLLLAFAWGCDTVEPVDDSRLVIEGFLDSGEPLPSIRLRRTLPPAGAYDQDQAAVTDADVRVSVGGTAVTYTADGEVAGTYRPVDPDLRTGAGRTYGFHVSWRDAQVDAYGVVPPEIEIENVEVNVPDEPVSAVLLDSLSLSDSLATGAYTGYIYPVEVTVSWNAAAGEQAAGEPFWVRAQLKPYAAFSSPVVDLFLRNEEIIREDDLDVGSGVRTWTGVYAVGVAREDDPLPGHLLRVSIVRSGSDYARFAASKDAPERREPISNLEGAAGIFTAISVDSLHVRVE